MTRKPLSVIDTIFIALVMLRGTEDVDYLIFEKDLDVWKVVGWLRRN